MKCGLLQEEELEKEEEEPDRLTLLLPQSKFDCTAKKTGYYADDGLNCEVFHYCQDNARHSWICPEGFLFHQVRSTTVFIILLCGPLRFHEYVPRSERGTLKYQTGIPASYSGSSMFNPRPGNQLF